ncbi:MAG: MBL fold metallo-hydrolase [Bacteroidetes bacterium]|nr:MAG: MBL fold metallo-hydrolase [Bacteroidota bacterium]
MNLFRITRLFFGILLGALLTVGACNEDDEPTPAQPREAGTVSALSVADVGDAGNGSDLQVTFNPAADESRVAAYRILVVKSVAAPAFDLHAAEAVPPENYTELSPTGAPQTRTLAPDARDTDGDPIANGVPLRVFVLSLADGINATENSLTGPSSAVTLVDNSTPIPAATARNVSAQDVGDQGNASDIEVRFDAATDESTLSAYRILIVPEAAASDFTLAAAEQSTHAFEVAPTGTTQTLRLPDTLSTAEGQPIAEGTSYLAFVLSIADGAQANQNALSEPSPPFTLENTAAPVQVTYICNDGILLSDGEHKVLIDGLVRWAELDGWVRPSAAQLMEVENGQGTFADIDLILITHNHPDHYNTAAVSNYLSNHPQTRLLAPPQVLANFAGFDSQIIDLSIQQFDRERLSVGGIDIDVLFIKHFNVLGFNFCNVENFGYVVHLGGKRFLHFGDVDLSHSNLDQLNLLPDDITAAFLPTFADLVNDENRDALLNHVAPETIVTMHFLLSQINDTQNQVSTTYPGALFFDTPFQTLEF